MRTLAGSVIGDARYVLRYNRDHSPMRRNVALDEVGSAGLYLLSDLSKAVTGEVMYVDSGFHALGIPAPTTTASLKSIGVARMERSAIRASRSPRCCWRRPPTRNRS